MATNPVARPAPMPGARPGVTRLPFEDVAAPAGFPGPLAASDAINFTDVGGHKLPGGTKLFRVYGGPAGQIGSYWSPLAPPPGQKEAEWRADTAVELSWNQGTSVAELTVPSAGMHAWVGGIAPQPAEDISCNYLPGFLLPGGGKQYKLVERVSSTDVILHGSTPWPTPRPCPTATVVTPAPPPTSTPLSLYHDHADRLQELAQAVEGLAGSAAAEAGLGGQAARLTQAHHDVHRHLAAGAGDLDAMARLQHTALAHVGLRRHLYIDPEWRDAQALVEKVVKTAVALAGLGTPGDR